MAVNRMLRAKSMSTSEPIRGRVPGGITDLNRCTSSEAVENTALFCSIPGLGVS